MNIDRLYDIGYDPKTDSNRKPKIEWRGMPGREVTTLATLAAPKLTETRLVNVPGTNMGKVDAKTTETR